MKTKTKLVTGYLIITIMASCLSGCKIWDWISDNPWNPNQPDPPATTNDVPPDVEDPPVVTNEPPTVAIFTNPVIANPYDIAEQYNWKVYVPDMAGNTYAGRKFSIKWPSIFYRELGCRENDTICLVNGVQLSYYQLDTGESNNAARLCYTDFTRPISTIPNPVFVDLVYKGKRVGCMWVTDPSNGVVPSPTGGSTSQSRWGIFPTQVILKGKL